MAQKVQPLPFDQAVQPLKHRLQELAGQPQTMWVLNYLKGLRAIDEREGVFCNEYVGQIIDPTLKEAMQKVDHFVMSFFEVDNEDERLKRAELLLSQFNRLSSELLAQDKNDTVTDLQHCLLQLLNNEVVKKEPSLAWALQEKHQALSTLHVGDSLTAGDQQFYQYAQQLISADGSLDAAAVKNVQPSYKHITKGLSLDSICANSVCIAFNDHVYVPKGLGEWNIQKECYHAKCPSCQTKINRIWKLIFWDCGYSIEGQVALDAVEQKGSLPNKFMAYEIKSHIQEWHFLEVKTQ